MISVIIASDRRVNVLAGCLDSLNKQSILPDEIIIAHAGSDIETKALTEKLKTDNNFKVNIKYFNLGPLGAAKQRNKGAEESTGDIIFFLDDDVVCEPNYIKETMYIFLKDNENTIGGVSGTIVNQVYVPLSRFNKKLFDFCLSSVEINDEYAGRVVGPAVNFLPSDTPNIAQTVDWLPSVCCAYRRNVFFEYMFNEQFKGYSFMEDVELSCRIGKLYKLINTTSARLYHEDLGGKTHKNWFDIGKMQVLNRWHVMVNVLHKNSPANKIRFFYYQIYCMIAEARMFLELPNAKHILLRWIGRAFGIVKILFDGRYIS